MTERDKFHGRAYRFICGVSLFGLGVLLHYGFTQGVSVIEMLPPICGVGLLLFLLTMVGGDD